MATTQCFYKVLKSRMGFAALSGILDYGFRIFTYKTMVGGFYQSWGSVNSEQWHRVPPGILAALFSCWIAGPLEVSKKAFFADKKFPVELRNGYTSVPNALFKMAKRDPFSLFKNSSPAVFGSFIQTGMMFVFFDYFYECVSPLFREEVMPKWLVKGFTISVTSFLAAMLSFPISVRTREMIELNPRQIGQGVFEGNYRKAFAYYWMSNNSSNMYAGLISKYLYKTFPTMFVVI